MHITVVDAKQRGELSMLFVVPPKDSAIPKGDEGDFSNERVRGWCVEAYRNGVRKACEILGVELDM